MNETISFALALALFAAAMALAREVRLRRAIERLLAMLLSHWPRHTMRSGGKDRIPDGAADDGADPDDDRGLR